MSDTSGIYTQPHDDEFSFVAILLPLALHWRLIVTTTILAVLCAAIGANLVPKTYQATAKVVPLRKDFFSPIGALTSNKAAQLVTAEGTYTPVDIPTLHGILQSHECYVNLGKSLFPGEDIEKKLGKQFRVLSSKWDKTGVLTISAIAPNAKLASDVANAAVVEMIKMAYEMRIVADPNSTAGSGSDFKGGATIRWLEAARVPDKPRSPNRRGIVALVGLSAGFVSILIAFTSEWLKKLGPADRQRLLEIKTALWG